jgi:hypothetical protein
MPLSGLRRRRHEPKMESYTNCKVGEVGEVMVQSGNVGFGYGFRILGGAYGRPLVAFAFATEANAKQARAEIEKAVAKAVEVTPQG